MPIDTEAAMLRPMIDRNPAMPEPGTLQTDPELIESIIDLTSCRDAAALTSTLKNVLQKRLGTEAASVFRIEFIQDSENTDSRDYHKVLLYEFPEDTNESLSLSEYPVLEESVRKQQPVLKQGTGLPDTYAYPMMGRSAVTHLLYIVGNHFSESQIKQAEILWKIWQHLFGLIERNELDGLTGLLNRVAFENRFTQIFSAGPSQKRRDGDSDPKVLALVDIDHFKLVNDQFGHLYGDEVLVQLSRIMSNSFRGSDLVFRYGGEEFVVILRNCTIDSAETIFERFREKVEHHRYPQIGQKTVSIGMTSIENNQLPTTILDRADKALYFSKENGRNQCSIFEALVKKGKLELPPDESKNIELF